MLKKICLVAYFLLIGFVAPVTAALTPNQPFIVGLAGSINDGPEAIVAAKWANAGSIRIDAPWAQVERLPGQFQLPNWLDSQITAMTQRGIEPVLILAYGNAIYKIDKPIDNFSRVRFGNYAEWLVKSLKGRVKYFQLWNEWEAKTGGTDPGSAADYFQLAAAVVPRLRVANPEAILIASGISYPGLVNGWANEFIQLGGHQLFDVLAAHPYVWHSKKDWHPEAAIDLLDRFSAKARNSSGNPMPVFVTEFGYPDYFGELGIPATTIADYLKRFMLLAASKPWIKGVWWYCIRDQGSDRANKEHSFGIFSQKYQPKEAAYAFKDIAPYLATDKRGALSFSENKWQYRSASGNFNFSWNLEQQPYIRPLVQY